MGFRAISKALALGVEPLRFHGLRELNLGPTDGSYQTHVGIKRSMRIREVVHEGATPNKHDHYGLSGSVLF